MTTVIDARDVFVLYRAVYGDVAALRGLSLTVEQGQVVGVIGPSGAGKSTLLELCSMLQRPSSGQFTVLGTSLDKASNRQLDLLRRTQIGIVRQHYDRVLPSELTVADIVSLPLRLAGRYRRRQSRQWVDQLLTAAGLRRRAGVRPHELSGGEQQRVAVCAALVTRPRLLLADEPTGELDPRTSSELLDTMLDLTGTVGATALIVTHDPAVAERCDRVIHIRDGRVAAEGSTESTLLLDRQGWLRLPEPLRQVAGFQDRVAASARWGVVELHTKDPRQRATDRPQSSKREVAVGQGVEVNIDRVSKSYRRTDEAVVQEFTHTFAGRRLHVIAGASGSGKSTLLNLIAMLDRPNSGEISIDGRRVESLAPSEAAALRRESVGFVSQHSTLVEHLSVRENVELGLTLRGIDQAEARDMAMRWLEWVGLGDHTERRADQLSGGEQRLVALARALAPQPALLLADEPTAHLDQLSGRLVIRLLQAAVADSGITIIAATHDPDVIAGADTVLHLDDATADPRVIEPVGSEPQG